MADKIAEILNSGRLQKVEEICNNEKAKVLSLFNRGKKVTTSDIAKIVFRCQNSFIWHIASPILEMNEKYFMPFQFGVLVHLQPNNGIIKA